VAAGRGRSPSAGAAVGRAHGRGGVTEPRRAPYPMCLAAATNPAPITLAALTRGA